MKILFIEDEVDLSALGAEQLRSLGHEVFEAPSLQVARAYLDDPSIKIHLIIADHRLPDGYGIDFLIEQAESAMPIPAVVVSGCLTPADIAVLNRVGIPFFRKPVLYSYVVRKFRQTPPVSEDSRSEGGDGEEDGVAETEKNGLSGWLRGIFSRFRRS